MSVWVVRLAVACSWAKPAPNIVLFVLDDVGWSDVSAYTGPDNDIQTPVFDRMAKEGVLLTRHYAAPVCSPSRATLMQGRFAWKTGLQQYNTIMPGSRASMRFDQATLAELLRTKGYATHAIGKWHLGYAKWRNTPTHRGFDGHTAGYFQGEISYYNKTFKIPERFLPFPMDIEGLDWWENEQVVRGESSVYNKELYDKALTRVLAEHNASAAGAPLFLYYATQLAHVPLDQPPPQWDSACTAIAPGPRRTYCAMMRALDDSLLHLAEQLAAFGLWEDTLLLVTSDNGGMPNASFPASAGCNFPLRAGKGNCFEGGVRVPAFVSGGVLPQSARGTVNENFVSIVDWYSTVAALAGAAVSPEVDSLDLWPTLTRGVPLARPFLPLNLNFAVEYPNHGEQAGLIAADGWKIVLQNVSGPSLNYDGWFPCGGGAEPLAGNGRFVFNVLSDPHERTNLYNASDPRTVRLEQMLAQARLQYSEPQSNTVHPLALPELHHGVWAPWVI